MARGDDRRNGLRAFVGTVVTLFLVLALTPDSIGPTPSGPVPAAAATEPTAGSGTSENVVLLGDSVTEQAFGYLGGATDGAPSRLERWSHYGWTLPDAASHAGTAVDASSTGTLVIAAGPNDAAPWDDGWTSDDVERWQDILDGVPATTCVAVVLPGWGDHLDGTPWARSMEEMRTDVQHLVDARNATGAPTLTVDWLPIVTQHPDYIAADGIHLATTAAATARQSLYWQAVATCQAA